MNERKTRILRTLTLGARHSHRFTEGEVSATISARHLQRYLDELVEDGLVTESRQLYAITDAGHQALAAPLDIVPARLFHPASTKGPYKPPTWNVRPGAEDHKRYQSRGIGA